MSVSRFLVLCALPAALLLQGCAKSESELNDYIREVKQRPGGPLPPLPTMKVFPPFEYAAQDLRDPFAKVAGDQEEEAQVATATTGGLAPDPNRRKEELESYPLDALDMVGTLGADVDMAALVKDPTGVIHRVRPNNYLGQNDGKITEITPSKISLVEIVPDGLGGYIERPASLALTD